MQPITERDSAWIDQPGHHAWLEGEGRRLLDFCRHSQLEAGGFGALDSAGRLVDSARADTMITARMTHSYALAAMRGIPGTAQLAEHGIAALGDLLQDPEHGGWWASAPEPGTDAGKAAYIHAFVVLAASSASQAGLVGASHLLTAAIDVIEHHFWSDEEQAMRESFHRDWSGEEPYRGGNSNMHATEAFLALADVTGDDKWLHRALAIVERLIHSHAASNGYRVIEHFNVDWQPLPDYNINSPADAFRPYGTTPGHSCEWARLMLHLEAALTARSEPAPDWLLVDARGLFDTAMSDAWAVDGAPGMIYTLNQDGRPCLHERMHWTVAEAAAAAAALYQRTDNPAYEQWYLTCWDYITTYLVDEKRGSWHHELDRHNQPGGTLWGGKPDLYHAYQATLLPGLPLSPALAVAVSQERHRAPAG